MISPEHKDQHAAYAKSVGTPFAMAVTRKRQLGYHAKAQRIKEAQKIALGVLEYDVPDSVFEIVEAATDAAYMRELENANQAEEIFRFLLSTDFPLVGLTQADLDLLGGAPTSLDQMVRQWEEHQHREGE